MLPDFLVAPFTGAWIETSQKRRRGGGQRVAPFTGAWIETVVIMKPRTSPLRRPFHRGVDRNKESLNTQFGIRRKLDKKLVI